MEKTCRDQEKVIEQLEAMVREGAPPSAQLALPAPIAVPKTEPPATSHQPDEATSDMPPDAALRLRIRELESKLKFSEEAHQDEMADVLAGKLDLQMQLARLRR